MQLDKFDEALTTIVKNPLDTEYKSFPDSIKIILYFDLGI
jgi:hypothetical protein